MLRFINQQGQLVDWTEETKQGLPDEVVFLDLFNPSRTEEIKAELWLEHQLPTKEEMEEIEESSRLYVEDDTLYMTAWLPVGLDSPQPETAAITFALCKKTLATVRYADPQTFRTLGEQLRRKSFTPSSGDTVFLFIVERIIARIADALQNVESDLKRISHSIFSATPQKGKGNTDLDEVVKRLGRHNELVANLRESLVSISRMLQFFLHNSSDWMRPDLATQFRSVMRDVSSLDSYTTQQNSEMNFLLDATLGLINNQQNKIIKVLTVASLVFMPPTLIAGIYGMNFKHMPELDHPLGYPLTWLFIILSGVLPIVFLKLKKML